MNLPLKLAIWRSGRSQWATAAEAAIDPSRLSRIVNGRVAATSDEALALATVLDVDPTTLFPEFTQAATRVVA